MFMNCVYRYTYSCRHIWSPEVDVWVSLLDCLPTIFFSLFSDGLANQRAPRICLSLLPPDLEIQTGVATKTFMWVVRGNQGLHACTATILPIELSPQLRKHRMQLLTQAPE